MYPAFNHLWRIFLSIGILLINHSWLILSKQPLMSPSSIHCEDVFIDNILKHYPIASCVDLSGLNPYEFLSALVSETGSRANKWTASIALSFIVGIPNGRILFLLFGM